VTMNFLQAFALSPGAAQHKRSAVVRCRPGAVTHTVIEAVPALRCITSLSLRAAPRPGQEIG